MLEDSARGAYPIEDKTGRRFTMQLFRPADPGFNPYAAAVKRVCAVAFRDTDPEQAETNSRLEWILKDTGIGVIIDRNQRAGDVSRIGRVAGFHSFLLRRLPEFGDATLMYSHYVAVDPEYQGTSLQRFATRALVESFKPNVFAATTHSAALMETAKRVAYSLDYDIYPRIGVEPPYEISHLGREVIRAALGDVYTLTLDSRLVRTSGSPYTQDESDRPYLLFEELNLLSNQGVLYTATSPAFTSSLAEGDFLN